MTSERQLLANRTNGKRSRGPRTAAGRAASARNATKHGIFASARVLAGLGESAADWTAFRGAVVAALAPADEAELALTEWYANLAWRATRCVKFELAAASVALEPAAALMAAQAPDPDVPPGGLGTAPGTGPSPPSRPAADAVQQAIALLARLADAGADEPVDPHLAEHLWAAACAACDVPPPAEQDLISRFWTTSGRTRTGTALGWAFCTWTVATVRAVLAFLAGEAGKPPDRVAVEVGAELAKVARYHREQAAEARRVARARQSAQIEAAMNAVGRGPGMSMLELACRYEKHLAAGMEGTLRQLAMLRTLRAARTR